MRLTEAQLNYFIREAGEILKQEKLHEMKKYIQHGSTTTFTHCLVVAYYSYVFALRLPVSFDIKSIIRGALLHDFYLYDWHIPEESHKLHGFVHPGFALKNSRKYFKLNKVEEDIIGKHMWPLTLTHFPVYREAFLVSFVDKYCSFAETFYFPVLPKDYKRLSMLAVLRKSVE